MGDNAKSGFGRRDFLKGVASAAVTAGIIGTREAKAFTTSSEEHKISRLVQNRLLPHPKIDGSPKSEEYWHRVRKSFVLPENYLHLNTGTTGSPPLFTQVNLGVYNLQKSLDPRDWEKNLNGLYPDLFPIVPSARAARQAAVAAAYGANPDEIVLDYNTSDGLNLVFAGTPWKAGDRIITTSFEHPALAGPTAWARDYHGVQVAIIDIPSNFTSSITVSEVLSWFESELGKPLGAGNKQYVAFSEIFYKNGVRLPVKEISMLAKQYGAYVIVDSAHGWGQIPINAHDYGADFIAGAGHKWLSGGPGTGILYVRKSGDNLPPFAMGNYYSYGNLFVSPSVNFDNRNWSPAATIQSRGEINTPAIYTMTDSLSFFTHIGLQNIYERGVDLGDYLKMKIEKRWGAKALWVQRNSDPAFATFLTCFSPFQGKDDSSKYSIINSAITKIHNNLAAETPKINIRSVTWRDKQTDPADNRVGFRISTHAVYNNYEEINYLLERLVFHVDASGLAQL